MIKGNHPTKFVKYASFFGFSAKKENSQTRTMENGMIRLYAINSSELLRHPPVVSDKFVTIVKILLNKRHTLFITFCTLDFTFYRLNFTK